MGATARFIEYVLMNMSFVEGKMPDDARLVGARPRNSALGMNIYFPYKL
jgi:hypothetical protein